MGNAAYQLLTGAYPPQSPEKTFVFICHFPVAVCRPGRDTHSLPFFFPDEVAITAHCRQKGGMGGRTTDSSVGGLLGDS